MAGVLSTIPQGVLMDPKAAAIMQAGLGMMAASGPSRTPVSLGQAFGQAGQQGMQAFAQANQANQQQQMYALKMQEVEREAMERQRREQAMAAFKAQFPQLGTLADMSPQLAAERAFPKQEPKQNPFSRLDPKDYTPESLTAFQTSGNVAELVPRPPVQKAPDPSPLARLVAERNALPPNDPNRRLYDEAIRKQTTHQPAPSATVINRQESEFGKAVGKELGDMYSGLLRADMNAPATIAKYERLGSLLGQVNTGKFKGTTTELKSAAKGLGIDLTALGITDDVAPVQAARALSNQLALELRNPAGGAGMPGAMSDSDRMFLSQMIPSPESDPAAITKMIDYRTRIAKREQQVARMARDYRKKNGTFDEGFYNELQSWSEKNPLFPEASSSPAATVPIKLSPKAQAYVDKARSQGR